jgi:NADH-quinone oxidoreductase subunit L
MESLIVFLPLIGALVAGFAGRAIGGHKGDVFAQIVSSGLLVLSAILAWIVFIKVGILAEDPTDKAYTVELLRWVTVGNFSFDWALRIDTLTGVMLVVITTVSSLVHIYSIGYMHHDPSIPRFQAYLSLFTFMMLMLVTADNLVQMFFGWEGVGLASYLLIGFWYKKPSANAAAIKAFVVNRVGDFGFALGIFGVFILTGSLSFDSVFNAIPGIVGDGGTATSFNFLWFTLTGQEAVTAVCLLLFMGAMGKSAQLGLHTWLPDAMEGPTPVSALIHAATMVTAGVFMVCRLSPIFEYSETALMVVTFVGASTAFFAATIGLTQNDIKRVIAYSTCSQLGYMFFAAGVSAYPAAMFHLFTHAFFKALLFLGAGAVIHAVSDEQDMRKMGGLAPYIKKTMLMMWIGSLALTGIGIPGTSIGFAGFFSKDAILESAYAAETGIGRYAFWLGIAAAIMTAFYSWRLLWMTFHTPARGDEKVMAHVHESPNVMLVPLYVLAIGAVFAGVVFAPYFTGHHFQEFWGDSILILESHQALENAHHVPILVKVAPLVVGLIGIFGAIWVYRGGLERGKSIGRFWGPFYQFSFNKWYFDELYDFLFVRPCFALGRLFWKRGDGDVIDGLGPDGVAKSTSILAGRISLLQSGYLYHYAFAMLIGVVVLISFYLLAH